METRKSCTAQLLSASTVSAALVLALIFGAFPRLTQAKDLGASGVFLFQGPNGPAYVQFNGLLVNGKMELRACGSPTVIPKSEYHGYSKLSFASLYSLERMQDGSMTAVFNGSPSECVLPGNYKWDKENELSVKELIDKSTFQAQIAASDPPGRAIMPVFAPGDKIYFVSSTDVELAEFLRAGWAPSIDLWHAYLAKFSSAAHLSEAKKSLEGLLVADGNDKLAAYRKTAAATPDYDLLKNAFLRAQESKQLEPDEPGADKLLTGVHAALSAIADAGTLHLSNYKAALAGHKPGYPNLPEAKRLATAVTEVDSQFAPGTTLLSDALAQEQSYDKMLAQVESSLTAKAFDEAARTIKPYLAFREEEPRLKDLVKQTYDYYIDAAAQDESKEQWNDSIRLYQSALDLIETEDAKADLVRARAGAHAAENKAAADSAVERSKSFVDAKDYISAYQTLTALSKEQQALVSDQLDAIRTQYEQAAIDQANKLQKTHLPIKGWGDEGPIRLAWDYFESVYELTNNDDVKINRDLLSDKLTAYYIEKAKIYIAKPAGTGIGIGWNYLTEAGVYTPNKPEIRDAQTTSKAIYQMRSKLSIKVEFHDQTARRDSEGFSTQLQNAIAQGLENSGMGVKVILPDSPATIDPNYILVGQIVEHRDKKTETIDTLKSHYTAGTHEATNPEWIKADKEYEQASADYEKYDNDSRLAQSKGKKSEMDIAINKMSEANQKKLELKGKLDSIPEHLQEDTILEYSYSQHNIEIIDIVDISYRITDAAGNTIGEPAKVTRSDPHKYTVLEGLNSADRDGIHAKDAPPVENQLLTDSDDQARNDLVASALAKVRDLPSKILAKARELATTEDFDAAGEQFIIYLNCTAPGDTPERQEASKFLADHFNLRHTLELSASAK